MHDVEYLARNGLDELPRQMGAVVSGYFGVTPLKKDSLSEVQTNVIL